MNITPVSERKWQFSILHCVGLIILFVALQFWVAFLITKDTGLKLEEFKWFHFALLNGIPGIITAAAGAHLIGLSLRGMLLDHLPNLSQIISAALAVFGIAILGSELTNLLHKIQPYEPEFNLIERLLKEDLIGVLITVSIIAPIIEEWIFRGVIFEGLKTRHTLNASVMISSLLFGLVHLPDPWIVLSATLLGLFLCWIKLRTGSLMICVISHAIFNLLPFFFLRIIHVEIQGFTTLPGETVALQPLWFDLIGVALLAGGIFGIKQSSEDQIQSNDQPSPGL